MSALLCPFLGHNGVKYKITHKKGPVDKMLSHFITGPLPKVYSVDCLEKSQRTKITAQLPQKPVASFSTNILLASAVHL